MYQTLWEPADRTFFAVDDGFMVDYNKFGMPDLIEPNQLNEI